MRPLNDLFSDCHVWLWNLSNVFTLANNKLICDGGAEGCVGYGEGHLLPTKLLKRRCSVEIMGEQQLLRPESWHTSTGICKVKIGEREV